MGGQLGIPLLPLERPSLPLTARNAVNAMDEKLQTMRRWTKGPAIVPRRIFNNSVPPFLLLLLPSFVANYLRPGTAMKLPRHHSTSYLDGLRGVAAFAVYIYHYTLMWRWTDLEVGYGSPHSNRYWYQLPLVRILIAGRASVTVFFVVSGYVLSIRTLRLIHSGGDQQQTSNKVLSALSSSVFRRPLRLYLPIAAATAMLAVLVQTRFPFHVDHISRGGVAIKASNMQDQFFDWWATMARLVNPFTIEGIRGHGRHRVVLYISPLWTIPTEFKGSLAVFLMLLAFARARRALAMAATLVMGVVWQLWAGDADMALFMAGLFLAELCIVVPPSSVSAFVRARSRSWRQRMHIAHHGAIMLLFFSALWLLSIPMIAPEQTPGFKFLARLTPEAYWTQSPELAITNMVHLFWLAVGSIMLVLSLMYSPSAKIVDELPSCRCSSNDIIISVSEPTDEESQQPDNKKQRPVSLTPLIQYGQLPEEEEEVIDQKDHPHDHELSQPQRQPLLQRLFTNRVAQYLGALSYSLYLCHESVNHAIGSRYARPGYELWEAYEAVFPSPGMGSMSPAQAQLAHEALPAFRWQYWSWYVLGYCINTVVLIWMSDLFMRAVDGPSVRFARWVSRLVE